MPEQRLQAGAQNGLLCEREHLRVKSVNVSAYEFSGRGQHPSTSRGDASLKVTGGH